MNDQPVIRVNKVSKSFRLPHEKYTGLKQALINFRPGRGESEQQKVLNNISFNIKKGEFFGIVGRNGSGKSTMLKLLAQIYVPDNGGVHIDGSLTPFIELGVGFNPELTGRENVYLNGALLGFDRKQTQAMYNDIVSFAELEPFMDQKLKNYSSGMQVRLAFSVAIRAQSDILLIDEVLAVGDALFQKKCYEYFRELKRQGRTVVFVSHDTGALEEYCDRGALIEKGELILEGPITDVITRYTKILSSSEVQEANEQGISDDGHWGSGLARIERVGITTPSGKSQNEYKEDEPIKVSVTFSAAQDIPSPVCGITITDIKNGVIFQSNTLWVKQPLRDMAAGDKVELEWTLPNYFNSGTFYVSPAVSDRFGIEVYDWAEGAAQFMVTKKQKSHAVINVKHQLTARYEDNQRG
ncbi:ABC transporter ATP-binding protein [Candidatus Saccharibacteria bacterium]|nr:ABC transporter ATP-binding protein [Candidatus Saccharibacteria bacterium]